MRRRWSRSRPAGRRTPGLSDLPRRLSTDGAPPGWDPEVGDIAYYAPWGNLAIYYKDFRYSEGVIKLATIEGPLTNRGAATPRAIYSEPSAAFATATTMSCGLPPAGAGNAFVTTAMAIS